MSLCILGSRLESCSHVATLGLGASPSGQGASCLRLRAGLGICLLDSGTVQVSSGCATPGWSHLSWRLRVFSCREGGGTKVCREHLGVQGCVGLWRGSRLPGPQCQAITGATLVYTSSLPLSLYHHLQMLKRFEKGSQGPVPSCVTLVPLLAQLLGYLSPSMLIQLPPTTPLPFLAVYKAKCLRLKYACQ